MLLDLPIDVRREILSHVLIGSPFDDRILEEPPKDYNPKLTKNPSNGHSTFRDLRSVCRMFRYITSDLAARDAFDLGRFKKLSPYDYQRRVDHVEFLLTHDRGFREALGRRQSWTLTTIMTPRLLWAIGNYVPSFYQNCRVFNLNLMSIVPFEEKPYPFRHLRHTEAEEKPSFHATTVNENLMLLSHCERIEVLHVRLTSVHNPNPPKEGYSAHASHEDHEKLFIRTVHAVRYFAQLREFGFVAEDDQGWVVSDLLPLRSAATLTSFTFDSPIFENDKTSYDAFDTFTDLKVLKINPLTEKFQEYILKSTIKLETFETYANEQLLSNIGTSFWKSPAFWSLETLSFRFDPLPHYARYDSLHLHFVEGISSLCQLKTLIMKTPLKQEWCLQFRHSNLQNLDWFIEKSCLPARKAGNPSEVRKWIGKCEQDLRRKISGNCLIRVRVIDGKGEQ
jgi:hypothetical protein